MRKPSKLTVETLEGREVPATMYFVGGDGNTPFASGDTANWVLGDGTHPANVPGSGDTAVFDSHQSQPCVIGGTATVSWGQLVIDHPGNMSNSFYGPNALPNLAVWGTLNINGGSMDGGWLSISQHDSYSVGVMNITTGAFTYTSGWFDSADDTNFGNLTGTSRRGNVYVYGGGTLNDEATSGQIGAALYIGENSAYTPSTGTFNVYDSIGGLPGGTGATTLYYDATLGVASAGKVNLYYGSFRVDASLSPALFEN